MPENRIVVVRSSPFPLLAAMRPRQWSKNGLLFLAFTFSIGESWQVESPSSWLPLLAQVTVGVLAFCVVSSAGYLINDLRDVERDRRHHLKRHRPLASGALNRRTAVVAAISLLVAGTAFGALLGWRFNAVLLGYFALTFSYSIVLKHVAIVDILTLAIGFVVRAVAGGIAIDVPISPWLYLCTLLGSVFVAIAKRRQELTTLGSSASDHRPALTTYTVGLLDQMTSIVAASTIMAYALYTVTAPNLPDNGAMLATVPFVLYGLFRYLFLVTQHGAGGSPEEVLLRDRPLQATAVLWITTAMAILVWFRP